MTFTVPTLQEHVMAQIESTSKWSQPKPPSESTVKRDTLALLRAYAGTSGSRRADKIDDEIDAPMVPLGLISETLEGFRFAVGPKPGLPPEVAAYACLDFMDRTGATARTALVATLASEVGGPGRAFKLNERDLATLLREAARKHPDRIEVSTVSGSEALAVPGEGTFRQVGVLLLHRHYEALGARPPGVDFASTCGTEPVGKVVA